MKEPRVKIRISGVARTGLDGRGPYRNKVLPEICGPIHDLSARGVNTVDLIIPRRSLFGLIDTVVNVNRLRL